MGKNEMLNIGSIIRDLRLSTGMTAKDFADSINVSYSTYSNYENNNRKPNTAILSKICEKLEIDMNILFQLATLPADLRDSIIDSYTEERKINQKPNTDLSNFFSMRQVVNSLGETKSDKINKLFNSLNEKGQDKALEQVEMLTKIPEYQAETPDKPEEE
ncbi:helix-turn-helix domain-containing protein [Frisingicoccus sp.]|uniref:helix-turn-helix domain-containing protein n=1 Tax=Frisingicoccus sp. TaxID=1918627 RepID=UPI003AB57BD5